MERNNIAPFADARQGTMFEGVLALPPTSLKSKFREAVASLSWEQRLAMWSPCTLPLKSLSDSVNRLGIATDVYTFLSPDAIDPIEKWLIKKGISVPVFYYKDAGELAYDLVFNRAVRVVYTADQEDAKVLGIRSTVVSSDRAWSL